MARIFRATYTKMRTVRDQKGRVVYDTKNGKKAARRENVLGKNGKPVLCEARKWYIAYRDADGIVRRVAGFTDKKATEQEAARLEREAGRRKSLESSSAGRILGCVSGPLAQRLEQGTHNPLVAGSNPAGPILLGSALAAVEV